jgi:hypothetical protein
LADRESRRRLDPWMVLGPLKQPRAVKIPESGF